MNAGFLAEIKKKANGNSGNDSNANDNGNKPKPKAANLSLMAALKSRQQTQQQQQQPASAKNKFAESKGPPAAAAAAAAANEDHKRRTKKNTPFREQPFEYHPDETNSNNTNIDNCDDSDNDNDQAQNGHGFFLLVSDGETSEDFETHKESFSTSSMTSERDADGEIVPSTPSSHTETLVEVPLAPLVYRACDYTFEKAVRNQTPVKVDECVRKLGILRALQRERDSFNALLESRLARANPLEEEELGKTRFIELLSNGGVARKVVEMLLKEMTGTLDDMDRYSKNNHTSVLAVRINGLDELLATIEKAVPQLKTARQEIKTSHSVSFYPGLGELFCPGSKLVCYPEGMEGSPLGCSCVQSWYSEDYNQATGKTKKRFVLVIEFIVSVGDELVFVAMTDVYPEFHDTSRNVPLKDLSHRKLCDDSVEDAALLERLQLRGEFYASVATKNHFLEYYADSFFPILKGGGWSSNAVRPLSKGGRVMVDVKRGILEGHIAVRSGSSGSGSGDATSDTVKEAIKLFESSKRTGIAVPFRTCVLPEKFRNTKTKTASNKSSSSSSSSSKHKKRTGASSGSGTTSTASNGVSSRGRASISMAGAVSAARETTKKIANRSLKKSSVAGTTEGKGGVEHKHKSKQKDSNTRKDNNTSNNDNKSRRSRSASAPKSKSASSKDKDNKKEKKGKKKKRSASLTELGRRNRNRGKDNNNDNSNDKNNNNNNDDGKTNSGAASVAPRTDLLSKLQVLKFGNSNNHTRDKDKDGVDNNHNDNDNDGAATTNNNKNTKGSGIASSGKSNRDGSRKKKKKTPAEGTARSNKPTSRRPPDTKITSRKRREFSFASIHGRSMHKQNKNRGNNTNNDNTNNTVRGLTGNDDKKKSVLKQKRERQQQKQQQTNEEAEPKQENHHRPDFENVSPASSYSSVDDDCSILTDGSYSADDLLCGAEDSVSAAGSPNRNMSLSQSQESSSSSQDSIINPTSDETTDGIFVDDGDTRRTSYKTGPKAIITSDTITASLESSMSSFPEQEEDAVFTDSPISSSSSSSSLSSSDEVEQQQHQHQHHHTTPNDSRNPEAVRGNAKRSSSPGASLRIELPGNPTQTVTRYRRIRFNEKVRVKRIQCQAQVVGDEEMGELWFQQEEYENIKRKTMALIKAIQEGNTGGVNYCTRGLERYFAIEEVQEKRNCAWDVVLDEQDLQRQERCFDPIGISRVYSRCTRQSSLEAADLAMMDQDSIAKSTRKTRQLLIERWQHC